MNQTKKEALVRKLTSRKLWACIACILVSLAGIFGVDGDTVSNVVGMTAAVISALAYILTEGRLDAKAMEQAQLLGQATCAAAEAAAEEEAE